MMDQWIEVTLRMGAAVVAGGLVGINRDMYGKPSGVRVHALVALGAALVTMVGTQHGLGAADPAAASRIVQGVIGGIGFLGAGVILRGGGDAAHRIYHVTTAASIWVTAGLGIACGAGTWMLATVAAVVVMVVLVVGLYIDRALYGRLGPEEEHPGD